MRKTIDSTFRFAVFPKQLISFNPMQYVTIRGNNDDSEIFDSGAEHTTAPPVITDDQYKQLTKYLEQTQNPALLPIQIAYYTGLRLGEVCGLTWQDIDLDEQYFTVRRSICYNNVRKRTIIGPTKRKKIRTVDFCDTLAEILRAAKQEQKQGKQRYGELYHQNYYISVKEKNGTYHEVYALPVNEAVPESYNEVSLVCLRQDGAYEAPSTVSCICRAMRKRIDGFGNFHFHLFRHTYTSSYWQMVQHLKMCRSCSDTQILTQH